MRYQPALVVLSLFGYAVAQGCGGSSDDTNPNDGGNDTTTVDSPTNDVAVMDTGTNDTGTDDTGSDAGTDSATDAGQDSGPNISIWMCGTATVTDCSQCTGFTEPCAYCNIMDASVLSGACVQTHTSCANVIPNGFQDCLCGDAGPCPENDQVCTAFGRCHTCEDTNTNNGLACHGGGTCDYADGGCL